MAVACAKPVSIPPSLHLAHKFTRANSFNDLRALLRNFFRSFRLV
jgi:hypothetical protein